jgi:hypothetical protein
MIINVAGSGHLQSNQFSISDDTEYSIIDAVG